MENEFEKLGFKIPQVLVNQYGIKIYIGTKDRDDWCIEIPKELIKKFCPKYKSNINMCYYLISERYVLDLARKYTKIAESIE